MTPSPEDNQEESEWIKFSTTVQKSLLAKEKEIESIRVKLRQEFLDKEKELHKHFSEREANFINREKSLLKRQADFENQLMQRQVEAEELRAHLSTVIADKEYKLKQAQIELEQEKERYNEESRKRIEDTSKTYVTEALETLEKKEKKFHFLSNLWSWGGALSLAICIAYFAWITHNTISTLPPELSWEFIIFACLKGLVAVGLISGLARYAFIFSNAYMHESLKNADRIHAINFGKFYLQSYGAAADWSQVKEAFANWNITGSTAFSSHPTSSVDVSSLNEAASIVEKLSKSFSAGKSLGQS